MSKGVSMASFLVHRTQNVSFIVTTVTATAFDDQTEYIRVIADQLCHISFDGSNATSADTQLAINTPEIFKINKGTEIRVIRSTADGTLNISELTQ